MKFTIDKNLLLENLTNVTRALSSKIIIPILNGVKLELDYDDEYIMFINNDKCIGIYYKDKCIGIYYKDNDYYRVYNLF